MPRAHGTVARGYGANHKQMRARWASKVKQGGVLCARCGRPIPADIDAQCPHCHQHGCGWDLGHDDYDRSKYSGPEHACCNRAAGGRQGAARSVVQRPAPHGSGDGWRQSRPGPGVVDVHGVRVRLPEGAGPGTRFECEEFGPVVVTEDGGLRADWC
jgi:hypothetical protein